MSEDLTYNQLYYQNNREKCLAASREYQAKHKEEYKAYSQEYYQKNKWRLLAKQKKTLIGPKPKKQPKAKTEAQPEPQVFALDSVEGEPQGILVRQEGDFVVTFD